MKTIFFLTIALLSIGWTACSGTSGSGVPAASAPGFIDSLPGSCPNLARGKNDQLLLSWIRELNDSTAVFCYATSTDGGLSFGRPVVIPGSSNIKPHSENLPKVIIKPSGEILAVWGAAATNPKNKYAGNIYYAQSFDGGQTWSDVRSLVSDTAGYDQRYFDLALMKNGEAGIIWLDNRKAAGGEGSAMYFAMTKGKNGFEGHRRIAEPCCQCCRTDLFVDRQDNIHVLYRGIIQDSIRDMVHLVSTNNGQTFSTPRRISQDNWVLNACPHTGPAMTENKEGLHFAWYTGGVHKGSFYTRSTNNGNDFVQHDSIALAGKHPQIAADAEGTLAIVWDEHIRVDDRFFTRIGIQKRTAEGKGVRKWFLTPDTATATYPVITPLKGSEMLVAWCQKKGEASYIAYQSVDLGQ